MNDKSPPTHFDAPAAILADYCDLKFVKGRKVAVISIEIPIEGASAFVAQFGTPDPARGVPVALARVVAGTAPKAVLEPAKHTSDTKERRRFEDLPPTQQAAMRCQEQEFREFASNRDACADGQLHSMTYSEQDARDFICDRCGVTSRSELNTNAEAAAKWRQLNHDYTFWLTHPDLR